MIFTIYIKLRLDKLLLILTVVISASGVVDKVVVVVGTGVVVLGMGVVVFRLVTAFVVRTFVVTATVLVGVVNGTVDFVGFAVSFVHSSPQGHQGGV